MSRALQRAMIRHGIPADWTAELAAALVIERVGHIKHVFFQHLLVAVPRAYSDVRHAFIRLHNEYCPDDPWDVDPDVHTNAEWHQVEIQYAAHLLNTLV
jgi:hypothetical protein